MLKAFFKDSAVYLIPAVVSRGLTFFLVPLYTRVLSPADYGSLDMLIVFASIVNLTIALEVSQGVARYYTATTDLQRKVAYASSALWFTVVCYSMFSLLMLTFTKVLAQRIMGQVGMETAFQIGIAYIWSNGLFYLIQNQFRWELRSKDYAIVSLVMSFTIAGVSVWLSYWLHWGIHGLLLGMAVGNLVGAMLGGWRLRNSFQLYFDIVRLREMLVFSTPLVFSSVAVWISLYIDRIMINHFLTIEEVGLYGIGYRLSSIIGLVMASFQGSLTPLIYTYCHEADAPRQIARIFRLFIFFSLSLVLGLSLFAKDMLQLLTTQPFYGGSVVVIYLVPAILLANMYIFAPGISIAKKTQYFIWINIGGAFLHILLDYLLIPAFGIAGAGMATLLGYLAIFIAHMLMSQRLYTVPHHWRPLLISVAITSFLAWYLPQLSLAVPLRFVVNILAVVVIAIVMVALGVIHLRELQQSIVMLKARCCSSQFKLEN